MKTTQLFQAQVLGNIAFHAGKKSTPCLNADLLKMFEGRQIGQTPKGEASSIEIMKAYIKGWDLANLAQPVN